MSTISVTLKSGPGFRPGETVEGTASWQLDAAPEAVEVRLFWRTEGRGTPDVGLVGSVRFDSPGAEGDRSFAFPLPEGPYSFSGKLISLLWGIEAVAVPSDDTGRAEIVLSPIREAIRL